MSNQELLEKAVKLGVVFSPNTRKGELKRLVAAARERQGGKYAKAGSAFVKVPCLDLDTVYSC